MAKSQKTISGQSNKRVDCAGCARSYEYDLKRTVTGKCESAATKAEADAQAMQQANDKLQSALANDCDPVACPACGAFTKEMKTYRWKRFAAGLACMGVGVLILLAMFLMAMFLHRMLIVATLLGCVCVLLGLAILAISVVDLIAPKKGRA